MCVALDLFTYTKHTAIVLCTQSVFNEACKRVRVSSKLDIILENVNANGETYTSFHLFTRTNRLSTLWPNTAGKRV